MQFVRVSLGAAAVVAVCVAAATPAPADSGPVDLGPKKVVVKGHSAPGVRARAALIAPANDNLAGAQFLPSDNGSISGSTIGSTAEPGERSHGDQLNPANNSIWYRWRSPITGHVIFRTIGSNFDTVLAAYQPARNAPVTVSTIELLAANDDLILDNSTTDSQIRFDAVAGVDYFIAVDGFGTAVGDVKLTWTTNDDFAARQPLVDPPAGGFTTFAVHNEGTRFETGEPKHAGTSASTSVWYRWSPKTAGVAEFQTTQSRYDPVLAVYDDSTLVEVASNDDLAPGDHRARVRFFAKPGKTYAIALAGFGGQSGLEIVRHQLAATQIRAGDASTAEGAAGTTRTLRIPVTLSTPSPGPVSVHFATADGTAKAGSDYTATSGTLTFAAGETTKFVNVTVRGDGTKEPTETFALKLTGSAGGFAIGDATGTGTITNDD